MPQRCFMTWTPTWWFVLILTPAILWARRRQIVYGVGFGFVLAAAVIGVEWLLATEADSSVDRMLTWWKASVWADSLDLFVHER